MPLNIYMITGQMGSGKDTAVSFLQQDIADYDPPIKSVHINFADAIRDCAKIIFGLTDDEMQDRVLKEKPLDRYPFVSPRTILRDIGMKIRDHYPEVWIEAVERKIKEADGDTIVLNSDLRFPNEEAYAREKGYSITKVIRPGYDGDPHPSEVYVPLIAADNTILNNGTLEQFRDKVINFKNDEI